MPGPPRSGASDTQTSARAASGRPAGAGGPRYGTAALSLLDNGYLPLPLLPGQKRPVITGWSQATIDHRAVADWAQQYPDFGIGLRCGDLIGVDIDILDPDLAHRVERLATERFGDTLVRVGLWPKRLLVYRTAAPFAKMAAGTKGAQIEILGQGQQFVAFGRHPDTGRDYYWPLGETPLDVPFVALPRVDAEACQAFRDEVAVLLGVERAAAGRRGPSFAGGGGITRDASGLVVDGRDAWLSSIAFHTVHDAVAGGAGLDPLQLSTAAWERFAETTDLARPRKDGGSGYTFADAARKVADKLRLLREGRLPPRDPAPVEAEYQAPPHTAGEARAALDQALAAACRTIEAWHADPDGSDAPQIGMRATVGLGKSQLARMHLLALRRRLTAAALPARLLVLPSHSLAEETAAAWRAEGVSVAVLRGYEAQDPATRLPMCDDIEAVRAAVTAGRDIQSTACIGGADRCSFFDRCRKQQNRREVEAVDVVVAAYDVLFSGLALDAAGIAAILIDDGCWQRVRNPVSCTWEGAIPEGLLRRARGRRRQEWATADTADLLDLRGRLASALHGVQPGVLSTAAVRAAGLDEADCRVALELERLAMQDPGLVPGMDPKRRRAALPVAQQNEAGRARIAVWRAVAEQLQTGREGRVRVVSGGPSARLEVHGVKPVHVTLQGKPILHLDATLRPELARTVLPRLTVREIEAAAPFMSVTLVAGSFGKGSLCPDPAAGAAEQQRRANRLAECVDYVPWQGQCVAPGRLLVVTYLDIKKAFAGIPGVEVAHFNAVAGLDAYRDVAGVIVIGRPLPRDRDLLPLTAAYFGEVAPGTYVTGPVGVRMRDGSSRTVRVMRHENPIAELLRAAICDEELIQAVGRGRGINRTAADPLAVHVLADVALPLVHDRVLPWDAAGPLPAHAARWDRRR